MGVGWDLGFSTSGEDWVTVKTGIKSSWWHTVPPTLVFRYVKSWVKNVAQWWAWLCSRDWTAGFINEVPLALLRCLTRTLLVPIKDSFLLFPYLWKNWNRSFPCEGKNGKRDIYTPFTYFRLFRKNVELPLKGMGLSIVIGFMFCKNVSRWA